MGAMDNELLLAGLLHEACVDELRHHVGRQLSSLICLLELHELLLEGLDLYVLLRFVLLLLELGLLVCFDLRHSPATLAGCLQHVGADAFAHCRGRREG